MEIWVALIFITLIICSIVWEHWLAPDIVEPVGLYELSFRKKFISKGFFEQSNNIVYDISREQNSIATFEIKSTFSGILYYNSNTYHIKTTGKFFTDKFEIVSGEQHKIGIITFWGWTHQKKGIVIGQESSGEFWEFDRYPRIHYKKKTIQFNSYLKHKDIRIAYHVELGEPFVKNTTGDCLRETHGKIYLNEPESLIALLGIFLNELVIYSIKD